MGEGDLDYVLLEVGGVGGESEYDGDIGRVYEGGSRWFGDKGEGLGG